MLPTFISLGFGYMVLGMHTTSASVQKEKHKSVENVYDVKKYTI